MGTSSLLQQGPGTSLETQSEKMESDLATIYQWKEIKQYCLVMEQQLQKL